MISSPSWTAHWVDPRHPEGALTVSRLMELVLENAGAQRGALLLAERDTLVLVARLLVEGARIETGLSTPLGECTDIAATVVHYAARTLEAVVLGDLRADSRFSSDARLGADEVAPSSLCRW